MQQPGSENLCIPNIPREHAKKPYFVLRLASFTASHHKEMVETEPATVMMITPTSRGNPCMFMNHKLQNVTQPNSTHPHVTAILP